MTNDAQPFNSGESTGASEKAMGAAFLVMLKEQEGVVRKVACMFCKYKDDREELIQEITYRLWAGFEGFRHESKDTTWVYSVALQTALMRKRAHRDWIDYVEEISEDIHPLTTEETKNVNVWLDIEQLRPTDKAILMLLIEGYQYEEVSRMLSIEPFTLRNRIHRLRKRLREKFI